MAKSHQNTAPAPIPAPASANTIEITLRTTHRPRPMLVRRCDFRLSGRQAAAARVLYDALAEDGALPLGRDGSVNRQVVTHLLTKVADAIGIGDHGELPNRTA